MKTIKHLQTAVLFLTAALAAPLVTANETPFRGTFKAVEIPALQFPIVTIMAAGGGNATQLGNFTTTYTALVNLVTRVGIGSVVFIAANGDRLFVDSVGQSSLTATPNVISIVETLTITGGTGRFANATGSLTLERLKDQVSGSTSGHFDGTIVIPNGK